MREYESLGKETLLSGIKRTTIDTQFVKQNEQRLIVIFDGHHTSKALYNLGERVITAYNYGSSAGRLMEKLLRLKEIPEIEEEEYLEYITALNNGRPIPQGLEKYLRRSYSIKV